MSFTAERLMTLIGTYWERPVRRSIRTETIHRSVAVKVYLPSWVRLLSLNPADLGAALVLGLGFSGKQVKWPTLPEKGRRWGFTLRLTSAEYRRLRIFSADARCSELTSMAGTAILLGLGLPDADAGVLTAPWNRPESESFNHTLVSDIPNRVVTRLLTGHRKPSIMPFEHWEAASSWLRLCAAHGDVGVFSELAGRVVGSVKGGWATSQAACSALSVSSFFRKVVSEALSAAQSGKQYAA